MKAVRGAEGGVDVVELEEPPGTGELLEMRSTSVCASDLLYIRLGTRMILGHELAGIREDGTEVVVEALYGCMECAQCLRGAYNLCPTHGERALGVTADGGMAEQFRAPAARLIPLPPGLELRDAAIVEPASVSWHAVRLAGSGPGKRVAVVGSGRARSARRRGRPPHGCRGRRDRSAPSPSAGGGRAAGRAGRHRRRLRRRRGSGRLEGEPRPGDRARRARGTIVVLGVHLGTVELDWMPLFHKEASIIPSLGYCRHENGREMEDAAAMLGDDPEIARTIITHRFPIEDSAEAFRVAGDRASGAIRVVIEP